jgi:hypothetical protein
VTGRRQASAGLFPEFSLLFYSKETPWLNVT